tara:strand:+ start:2299 stop:2658 length:360 start_codon:yes stop_codon:yes gene_type:complete
MQKLFENWRRFSEAEDYNPDTDYSAAGPPDDILPPPPAPKDKEVKVKPLVRVLDRFDINASAYAMIMKKFAKPKRSTAEYIKEFPSIDVQTKQYIKSVVKQLLQQRDIGIDPDNINFVS